MSGQPPEPRLRWAKSLIAITTFLLSVLFFTGASRLLGPLRRSTLVASFGLQTTAIIISSILVHTGLIDSISDLPSKGHHHPHAQWLQMIPIALLAFQAGGQIVASRMLQVDEIPTVVLTTVLADLLIDARMLARRNVVRNRRVATVLALFAGAMVSGAVTQGVGLECALWMAAGGKAVVMACWVGWRGSLSSSSSSASSSSSSGGCREKR